MGPFSFIMQKKGRIRRPEMYSIERQNSKID